MAWFFRERRGPAWMQGCWIEQTLASVSAPSLPLLAILGIIILQLTLSSYINYRLQMHQSMMHLKLFLLILPLFFIFAAQLTWSFSPGKRWGSDDIVGNVPWSMVALVVVPSGHGLLPLSDPIHGYPECVELALY